MKHIKFGKHTESKSVPTTLYHASAFKHDSLVSGFKRTGELVQWDNTESNKWLYATSDRAQAINQGFASLLEKMYLLDRYQSNGSEIKATFSNGQKPNIADLKNKKIYLYTISSVGDGWIKNSNEFNGLDDEYKTEQVINKSRFSVEEVDVGQWLSDKKLIFLFSKS